MVRTAHYPVVHRVGARRWWLGLVMVVAGGWLTGRLVRRVEVVGDSMRPTLEAGDRLLLRRALRGTLRPGDLVAVADPRQPIRIVVKRLASISPDGLHVLGDDPWASTDSRHFGPVAADHVRGRVVYRYHPAHRRARLSRRHLPLRGSPAHGGIVGPVLETELDRVLAPDYLGDVSSRSLDEIRSLREDCTAVGEKVSYLRRLVHVRIDIVVAELRRRAEGGDPSDLGGLVEELKGVLSGNVHSPGHQRMVDPSPPPDLDAVTAEFEASLGPKGLADLPDLGDDEVRALADRLAAMDRDLSSRRRQVFDRVDALGAELTRRYGSGEATVDSVLR